MIELYHWEPNGFYLKPLIALKEKGLAFASHYVDPTEPGGPIPHTNLESENNPEICGPVLVDGGEAITETLFMLEYIEEAYPQGVKLLPGNPEGNWRVRVWGRYFGERTAPALSTLGTHRYLAPRLKEHEADGFLDRLHSQEAKDAWRPLLAGGQRDADLDESRRKAADAVKKIEEALANGDWLVPSGYSIADIEGFALLNALPKLMPEACNEAISPRTMAWLRRVRERPAVAAALAMARTAHPDEAFAPGPEHARWG